SHSNMYGALGVIGTPIVRTDAAAVWATGEFWWQIPRSIQVVLEGKLPEGVTGKDVIITLCGGRVHGAGSGFALDGCPAFDFEYDDGVGSAGGLVPGGRSHDPVFAQC